jgi:hypothetical protein
MLVTFVVSYALFHWLLAFPVWDRYLLPLVPILAVLAARLAWLVCSLVGCRKERTTKGQPQRARLLVYALARRRTSLVTGALVVVLLAGPVARTVRNGLEDGADGLCRDPMDAAIGFLSAVPEGSVVYHHWLGWHYSYRLFDVPVYLAYWPHPAWLARDVQAFGSGEPRFIAFPTGQSSARVGQALRAVGHGLSDVLAACQGAEAPALSLYQIRSLADE